LVKRNGIVEVGEDSAVFRRRGVKVIHRFDAGGARHVLHDQRGIARDELAKMRGKQPCGRVVAAAGIGADDDADLLAGEEGLRLLCSGGADEGQDCERDGRGDGAPQRMSPKHAFFSPKDEPRLTFLPRGGYRLNPLPALFSWCSAGGACYKPRRLRDRRACPSGGIAQNLRPSAAGAMPVRAWRNW